MDGDVPRADAPRALTFGDPPRRVEVESVARLLPGARLSGPARVAGRPVFAKVFLGARGALHAAREAEAAAALAAADVPSPRLLDQGTLATLDGVAHAGRVLLFERVMPALDTGELALDRAGVAPAAESGHRRLRALAAVLGRLHAAGWVQDDAHLGNLIETAAGPVVVDLGALRRPRGRVLPHVALRALAGLLVQVDPVHWSPLQEIAAAHDLAFGAATPHHRLERDLARAWQARDRRARAKYLRACSSVHAAADGGRELLVNRRLLPPWGLPPLPSLVNEASSRCEPDRYVPWLFGSSEGRPLETIALPCSARRARRIWQDALMLWRRGVPVPPPIALLCEKGCEPRLYCELVPGRPLAELTSEEDARHVLEAVLAACERGRAVGALIEEAPAAAWRTAPGGAVHLPWLHATRFVDPFAAAAAPRCATLLPDLPDALRAAWLERGAPAGASAEPTP